MFKNAAALHRRQFINLLKQVGAEVQVRQPKAPETSLSPSNRILGKKETVTGIGEIELIPAIVSHTLAGAGTSITTITQFPAGIPLDSDVVLRFFLPDVLLDDGDSSVHGLTLIDTAKDIVIDTTIFEKYGKTARTGLPPIGPYILWAGFKIVGEIMEPGE